MTAALDAIRARNAAYDLGDRPHTLYSGHDCYVCAAHDRRILLAALERAEAVVAALQELVTALGDDDPQTFWWRDEYDKATAALRAYEDADKEGATP